MQRILTFFLLAFIGINLSGLQAQHLSLEWAQRFGGTRGQEQGAAVAVDAAGNSYVVGTFTSDNFTLAGGVLPLFKFHDIFLAKFDPSGNAIWAKSMGAQDTDRGLDVVVDPYDNVYITGFFKGTASFSKDDTNAVLTSLGGNDAFIVKYDSTGKYIWGKTMGGIGNEHGMRLAVDSSHIHITGNFNSDFAYFNAGDTGGVVYNTTATGRDDIFVAKYDLDGKYVWAIGMGGERGDAGKGITLDNLGNVYITGSFNRTVDFDPGPGTATLTAASVGTRFFDFSDAFVAKYDANGNYVWVKGIGGNDVEFGQSIVWDENGSVYVTGYFGTTTDFDLGAGKTLTSKGQADVFLAKYDSAGNYLWAKGMGGKLTDWGQDVDVDDVGNVYVTGYFMSDTITLNPGGVNGVNASLGEGDVFLVKYNSKGDYLWSGTIGGKLGDDGFGVTVNKGAVYATGYIRDTADVDPNIGSSYLLPSITLNTVGFDAYLIKLACIDTSSSVWAVDECSGSYTFNGAVYTAEGSYTQVLSNALGCDSTVVLQLKFYELEPFVAVNEKTLSVTESFKSYQWIKDGQDISGATNSTLNVLENGNYQVRVTNEQGCKGTSEIYTVNNATNIAATQAQKIRVFPNPVEDIVFVESAEPVTVSVVTIEGRELNTSNLAISHQISVKDWASGVYYINLLNPEGKLLKVEKIIKR